MGECIAIVSGKGGTGITTITANLGCSIALLGKKVCVVDANLGNRSLDLFLGMENRIVYDFYDVLNGFDIKKTIIKNQIVENLFLIASPIKDDFSKIKLEQVKDTFEKFRQEFDYILIDCPSGFEIGFQLVTKCVDSTLIVTTPDVISMRCSDKILCSIFNYEIRNPMIIVNKNQTELQNEGIYMTSDEIIDFLGENILSTINYDTRIITSTYKGQPIALDYNSEYHKIFKDMARKIIEINIEEHEQIIQEESTDTKTA